MPCKTAGQSSMDRLYLTPGEMIAAYSAAGRGKLNRSTASLLLLGILAGAIIAVAGAATNTAAYGIADTWTLRTVCALLFPFGLGLVVVTGAELFTGNCMLPITLLDGGGTVGQLLRNWALSYLGNILGAGLVAALCVFCGQLDYSSGALAVYTIRVVMGPQDDAFTEKGIATFLGETYSVTNEFDRMGCRMDGPVIEHVTDGNIISDGIAFGAIQVPTEGKPIIMMADRQTTGGYTKIANVISADFRLLGQLKAGDKVKFEKVSIQAAQEALLNQRAALRTLRRSLDM